MKRIKLLRLIVVFAVLFVGLGTISSQAQVTFEHYKTLKGHSRGFETALSFNPSGRYLASAVSGDKLITWDVNTGQKNGEGIQLESGEYHVKIEWKKKDGNEIAECFSAEIDEGFLLLKVMRGVIDRSPDGKYAAKASKDGTIDIKLWSKDQTIQTLQGHSEQVECVKFSEDGKYLASASADGTIIIWKQKEVNNKPSARIDKVWVEHNVQRTGIQQVYDYYWNRYIDTPYTYYVMRIHVDFTVDYKLNEKIRVCAFFYDRYGNKLTTSNNEYKTILGHLTVQSECTPIYEGCHWSDYVLEIPYSVIQRGENNYFYIEIQDSDNNNNSLVNSEYIYFSVH